MADDPIASLPKPSAQDCCLVSRSGCVESFWYDRLIECFWFDGFRNFGDLLARDIVARLSGRIPVNNKWSGGRYLTVGSTLHWARDGDVVWGSGMLYPANVTARDLRVCAVRGPLTREYLLSRGVRVPKVYGDPAILYPGLFGVRPDPQYPVGLVPHKCDWSTALARLESSAIQVIDVRAEPRVVVARISRCARIFSSSLHGVIIAESLGIPAQAVRLSAEGEPSLTRRGQGYFKFCDYYLGTGREPLPRLEWRSESGLRALFEAAGPPPSVPELDHEALLRACPFREAR